MDIFLGCVTSQAMNYAIRSGIAITASYALKQSGRLLKETPRSQARDELMRLQLKLESKIRIISPAIDMIELISARGNTSLESAVSLTKEIRFDMQRLGTRLSNAANDEALLRRKSARAKTREETETQLKAIISEVKILLSKIEDAVPLVNLAITTSGVNLSTKLSGMISPSRLLQASTFLTSADSKYIAKPGSRQQVVPTYTVSLYMLFTGHARPVDEKGVRQTTWKEVMHKAKLKLVRVPLEQLYDIPGEQTRQSNGAADSIPGEAKTMEFAYQLVVIEDQDDGRFHTFEENETKPDSFEDVPCAGIRDVIPIHEVSKVFYADTGKILNIGSDSDTNSPVLLLKRDVHAMPPRRMLRRFQMSNHGYELSELVVDESESANGFVDEQSEINDQIYRESMPNTPVKDNHISPAKTAAAWRLPADLDPEWMAFEVFIEDPESDSNPDESAEPSRPASAREDSLGPSFTSALAHLNLQTPSPNGNGNLAPSLLSGLQISPVKRDIPAIKTSLSLLEMLLKLTALQQFRQESHLSIEDELLNFFLEDSATAGAGPDKDYRQRLRHDAVRRVGFDPYDESPIKRRGEEYIEHKRGIASPRPAFDPQAFHGTLPYDDAYGRDDQETRALEYVQTSIEQASSPRTLSYSPSPYRLSVVQTPSRSSTPASMGSPTIQGNVTRVQYATSPTSKRDFVLATPVSELKGRHHVVRAQSEPSRSSPLSREIGKNAKGDEESSEVHA